ncbi:GYDIA family GHMP kinase [Mariniflexile sp.]|uniref:GYDIA family GHMP kinase n=1 Tax=Mariniflexile sp. TaxID=1979402 RepID=UPI00356B511D
MTNYYSNGKLLITGEYVVLDGALSLALPTIFGQSLNVEPIAEKEIFWKSFNSDDSVWFEDSFSLTDFNANSKNELNEISKRVIEIFKAAKTLNPEFLNSDHGYKISTKLTFPKNWGLGSSSTLLNNLAQWANVNPFDLLKLTFGGSGYDIACAQNSNPITYQIDTLRDSQKSINIKKVDFDPEFKEHLYFIYLNKKQNSREGIATYNANKQNITSVVSEISDITNQVINATTLEDFENLISHHEMIISKITKQPTVKDMIFKDFKGSVKSLGAWGGDFVLVASKKDPTSYFKDKGFNTLVPYNKMILQF